MGGGTSMIAHFSDSRKIVYINILRNRGVIVCGFILRTLLKTVSASTGKTEKSSASGSMTIRLPKTPLPIRTKSNWRWGTPVAPEKFRSSTQNEPTNITSSVCRCPSWCWVRRGVCCIFDRWSSDKITMRNRWKIIDKTEESHLITQVGFFQ